jgi:hypothetical protein
MKIFIYLSLCISLLFSTKKIFSDTQLSYPFREISKPLIKDDKIEKIIIYSAPRTGSTLLYLLFQYIFEDQLGSHMKTSNKKVIKTHSLNENLENLLCNPKNYLVIPVRNPIDSLASQIKISNNFTHDGVINILKLSAFFQSKIVDKIESDPKNLLIIKYEKFNNDFNEVFNAIESTFHVKIEESEKQKMSEIFSKESIKKFCQNLDSFKEYDDITGLHGNHISKDTRTLEEILPEDLIEIIYTYLAPISSSFGYNNQGRLSENKEQAL